MKKFLFCFLGLIIWIFYLGGCSISNDATICDSGFSCEVKMVCWNVQTFFDAKITSWNRLHKVVYSLCNWLLCRLLRRFDYYETNSLLDSEYNLFYFPYVGDILVDFGQIFLLMCPECPFDYHFFGSQCNLFYHQ